MSISTQLAAVRHAIADSCHAAGRDPTSVLLLAVSKTFGADAVIEAADAGQVAFGENYLQEALNKITEVHKLRPELSLEWHFIGPIQSNKTRPIAENFSWVHAVDREKIAQRLSEQRPEHLPPLNICLQVNVSGEDSKSGVSPVELPALALAVAGLPNIHLRGLMAIPEPETDPARQRAPFALLRELQKNLAEMGIPTDTLSMGMSSDMQAAIAEGATMVRIGTAVFGKRDYAN
jgi:pyridoxal phosphate enzyme (YggS family)